MQILTFFLLFKITLCERDQRIITTLKYAKYPVTPTIVSGHPSERGHIPYIVSIKEPATTHSYSGNILWLPLCGGSIITKTNVLTAAHCFEGKDFFYNKRPDLLRLVAGNLESDHFHTGQTETTDDGQWRQIKQVYLHKDFAFPENDIALVIVDEPWNYTAFVNYADTATVDIDYPATCYSAGFGRTKHGDANSMTSILLQARIDTLPGWKCTTLWEMDMASFVCTDTVVSDVAMGDSGGPLGCRFTLDPAEKPGRDILVGVVSGKNFDKTSLFTRVSRFKSWIENPSTMDLKKRKGKNSACKLFGRLFVHVITFMVLKYVVFYCKVWWIGWLKLQIYCNCCVVVCEHCQTPMDKHEHAAVLEGYSYHEKCRKCYVCSETNLHNAEVFKGVIFCSSCSDRIFRGCSTARRTKESARRTRDKSHRRRSHRTKEKVDHTGLPPHGILALTELIASSESSKNRSGSNKDSFSLKSDSMVVSAEMALTDTKPTYDGLFQSRSIKKNSAEMGMTTEVTQQLLNELNCPIVTRYKKSSPIPSSPTKTPRKKRSPCSDLRIAELGTSREIANMALRHKNELPVIIKPISPAKPLTSTSESGLNKESESGERDGNEWLDSAYSTLDESTKTAWMDRSFRSIMRIPFYAFHNKILRRRSLINNLMSEKPSGVCIFKKIKSVFHKDCTDHQKRGLKRLYSTINRKQVPTKLGWLNLASKNTDRNHSGLRLSNDSYGKRCQHFRASHSYRCMRAQAMKLAGPTKSELAVIRGKLKRLIAPGFLKNVSNYKRPAILMSQACGASQPASSNGKYKN